MKESTCTPELVQAVNEIARWFLTTHFSFSSDILCCSALARVTAPVSFRSLLPRLQWGVIRYDLNTLELDYHYKNFVAMATITTPHQSSHGIHVGFNWKWYSSCEHATKTYTRVLHKELEASQWHYCCHSYRTWVYHYICKEGILHVLILCLLVLYK